MYAYIISYKDFALLKVYKVVRSYRILGIFEAQNIGPFTKNS